MGRARVAWLFSLVGSIDLFDISLASMGDTFRKVDYSARMENQGAINSSFLYLLEKSVCVLIFGGVCGVV